MLDLNYFNETKKKIEHPIKKFCIPAAIIGVVLIAISIFVDSLAYLEIASYPLFLIAIIIAIVQGGKFSKLSHEFKMKIVPTLVEEHIENGRYDAKNGLDIPTVLQCEFLKSPDRSHTEDLITGSFSGVPFVSSDVTLKERREYRDKDGNRKVKYVTYFSGRMFVVEFNKTFDGYLHVLEGGHPVVNRGYNKVRMESIVFNKKFNTLATTDLTAFYVLTPHLMQAILDFEESNPGYIMMSFIEDKLYIGINNSRDTFSLRMFKDVDQSTIDEFVKEFFVIREIVEELRLNNRIFKKGE